MVSMQNVRHYCQNLKELELSRQVFEKYANIKFHYISQVGAELFYAYGRKDE
jgi:hypothetical protein